VRLIQSELLPQGSACDARSALQAFETLTESPDQFIRRGWSSEDVFWSRYFWIQVHALLRAVDSGPDAGLDQTVFKVLEHPFPECDPDWIRAESVDEMARSFVTHRVSS